jgi:hypothetical protein
MSTTGIFTSAPSLLRTGQDVKTPMITFLEKRLKLTLNQEKSAVSGPWNQRFLGFSMPHHSLPV